nr:hypothetical protein [Tanacetum cinerariifolium]
MFLNVEQLEKQLDKEDFQELGSIAAFNVLETQFQMFIMSRLYLDDEYVAMTHSYFIQYIQKEILEFYDTLIQHLESVKKSIDEKSQRKKEYQTIYDEEPMTEVQMTTKINVFAIGQQHTEQPKFNNEGEVDKNAKKWQQSQFLKEKSNEAKVKHDIDAIQTLNIKLEYKVAKLLKENDTLKKHYKERFGSIKITRAKTIEHITSLIASNDNFKAQLQEKGFAIAALKKVTTHYLPKEREVAFTKPHHMIASSSSRISLKSMPRFSSNDMVYHHYVEEVKKKTQERSRNSEPSLMPSARSQSTANGSKPKPRINNQNSRNWHASKSSCVTTKTVPIAEHSRNSRNFFDSKHFVCSTCQKCFFNANHDSCVTKFSNEVNSHAKVPSNKTMNKNKPIEQISVPNKQERQIPIGHRFSIKKTFVVQKKTMTPRSCLRWKPTGRIFKTIGLKWVPTGKIFTFSTTKVDSEPLNGFADITNQYECEQTLDVSASTLNLSTGTSFNLKEGGLRVWLLKRQISHKPGLQEIFN